MLGKTTCKACGCGHPFDGGNAYDGSTDILSPRDEVDKDLIIAGLVARIAELETDAAQTATRREKNRAAMAARRAARRLAGK